MKKTIPYLSKGLLSLLFFSLIFTPLSAQEWENLNEQVLLEIKEGKYHQALQSASIAKSLAEKKFGNNHTNYICSLHNLASANFLVGDIDAAKSIYLQSIKIAAAEYGQNNSIFAIGLYRLADLYQATHYLDKASVLYGQAYPILKNQNKIEEHYISCLSNMGKLYHKTGKNLKAEEILVKAIKMQEEDSKHLNPFMYAKTLHYLANLYRDSWRYEEAQDLYVKVKNIQHTSLGDNHPYYAEVLNDWAKLYEVQKQYEQAEILYLQALHIKESALGKAHPSYLRNVEDLVNLNSEK